MEYIIGTSTLCIGTSLYFFRNKFYFYGIKGPCASRTLSQANSKVVSGIETFYFKSKSLPSKKIIIFSSGNSGNCNSWSHVILESIRYYTL
jgi:hypothetical protein